VSSDGRHERIARNESRFRDINDRLERGLRQVRHMPERLEFICECGDRDCQALIALTLDEYEAVRRDSRRFAVVPGHVFPDIERIVARNDRYEVVEKHGAAVPIADETDPRAPGPAGLRGDDAPG
jgi:hypothetical protein